MSQRPRPETTPAPTWGFMLVLTLATTILGTLLYLASWNQSLLLGMLVGLSIAWGMRLAQATSGGRAP